MSDVDETNRAPTKPPMLRFTLNAVEIAALIYGLQLFFGAVQMAEEKGLDPTTLTILSPDELQIFIGKLQRNDFSFTVKECEEVLRMLNFMLGKGQAGLDAINARARGLRASGAIAKAEDIRLFRDKLQTALTQN